MFCDEVKVHFIAGRGGNGAVAFRREKYVPHGGPSGGNGGRGGSIYLVANENINTLAEFNTYKIFRAESGANGRGKDQAGSDAPDLFLQVPVGTLVFDEKKKALLSDLAANGEKLLIAKGGKGGFGNSHFRSSTRQAPAFAELGEPGEEKENVLELKLVADVGIIGLPSVGKSTLLSRISNARPKIADYPFTTIIPNLGLVTLAQFGGNFQQNFLACDLPGLIEGAHKGKGLGIEFLKHVVRNRVLIHLLDVNSTDPSADFKTINAELKSFDKTLAKKPTLIAFNKIDTISASQLDGIIAKFKKKNRSAKISAISCVTGVGLKKLLFEAWELLNKVKKNEPEPIEKKEDFKIFKPASEENPKVFHVKLLKRRKKNSLFEVTGRRIEQIVIMTDFSNQEAQARVYDVIGRMGINKALRSCGAHFGDEIKIGKNTIIYKWD